jgi:hypothetical protein
LRHRGKEREGGDGMRGEKRKERMRDNGKRKKRERE